jgi:hypothetical protein
MTGPRDFEVDAISTELSPSWETNSCRITQDIRRVLWSPNVHYRVHKSPPLLPKHVNAVHTLISLFDIHFNIIIPSPFRSS